MVSRISKRHPPRELMHPHVEHIVTGGRHVLQPPHKPQFPGPGLLTGSSGHGHAALAGSHHRFQAGADVPAGDIRGYAEAALCML